MNCPVCSVVKMNRASCRSRARQEPDGLPRATHFGNMLTSDHKVLLENQASRHGDKYAIIIQDSFTKWLQAFPTKTKGHEEVIASFLRFMPPGMKPDHVYTDNSKEFIKAMQDLNWVHDTSTPYRPETNGVVERAVRRVKERTNSSSSFPVGFTRGMVG